MFLWMFIEGLYLHNVVTVTVFQGRFPHVIYAAIGWGSPVLMTVKNDLNFVDFSDSETFFSQAIWAGFTAISSTKQKCWYGYNLTPYYWTLEGPGLIVILVRNFDTLYLILICILLKLNLLKF
jgi:PDF receptor